MTLLLLTAMCLSGFGLWRWLARRGLHPLGPDDTSRHGILVFLAILFMAAGVTSLVKSNSSLPLEEAPLEDLLFLQAIGYGVAILAVCLLANRFGVTPKSLGLRRHQGPPAAALALAGWIACYPFLVLAALINQAMVPTDSEILQDYLKRFLSEEGATSNPIVWLCIVVVLPVAEEIIFRGALFGGLRRLMPPWVAMVLAGLLFGLMHDGATVLPVATLGILLAWTYEQTGSLKTACLLHGLHNGFTLALAAYLPESVL